MRLRLFKFLAVFFIVLLISFSSASILYYSLKTINGYSPFACPMAWRCWPYWDKHPIPYLAVLSFSYSFFCTLWAIIFATKPKKYWVFQYVLLPITALLFGGYLSGIVWAYQDMQLGFFPEFSQAIYYTKGLAISGLLLSLQTAFASFPLNILAYIVSIIISLGVKKILSKG